MKALLHFKLAGLLCLKRKAGLFILILVGLSNNAWAGTYTATTSGNWSSNSTWSGNSAPPATVTSDQIIINSGVTVTLDENITINGTLASLHVEGTLAGSSSSLFMELGTLTGGGTINAGAVSLTMGSSLTFAGTIVADQKLILGSGTALSLSSTGLLQMGSGSTISMEGGTLSAGSGKLTFSSPYSVIYTAGYSTTGAELSGSGLQNVTVSSGNVTLSGSCTVNGTLYLTGGMLMLNGNTLTIGSGGSISTTGNYYIITDNNGYVSMSVSVSNTGGVYYPVGTAKYFYPATITLNSGSNNGSVSINVSDNVYAHPPVTSNPPLSNSQSMVDATWDVQSNIGSPLSLNMKLEWNMLAEVNNFDHNHAYISHYSNSVWDVSANGAATSLGNNMYSITRANITSLSPFAVFDDKTAAVKPVDNSGYNAGFEVYPNPAMNNIYIQSLSPISKEMYVEVMNINGKILGTYVISDRTAPIDISSLPKGMYFIKLYNNNTSATAKFVKF